MGRKKRARIFSPFFEQKLSLLSPWSPQENISETKTMDMEKPPPYVPPGVHPVPQNPVCKIYLLHPVLV